MSLSTYRPTGPTPDVVNLVLLRDGWKCVVCGDDIGGTKGWDYSLHHRRGRDGKPDSHMPQNLITVCGGSNVDRCHGRIHARRYEARSYGWRIDRNAVDNDPLHHGVLVAHGSRYVYLSADGQYSDHPPGGEPT